MMERRYCASLRGLIASACPNKFNEISEYCHSLLNGHGLYGTFSDESEGSCKPAPARVKQKKSLVVSGPNLITNWAGGAAVRSSSVGHSLSVAIGGGTLCILSLQPTAKRQLENQQSNVAGKSQCVDYLEY